MFLDNLLKTRKLNKKTYKKNLKVKFFKNYSGKEPVREWLKNEKEISFEDRKKIGEAIKYVECIWPIGMPLVKTISGYRGLKEIRVKLENRSSRIFFTILDGYLVLLHGIIKKSQKTPKRDLEIAYKRKQKLYSVKKQI